MKPLRLDISHLRAGYAAGRFSPSEIIAAVYDRIEQCAGQPIWIHLVPRSEALAAAERLQQRYGDGPKPPLYGLPFAVKDNIDVAGLPTTAGCPDFAYVAQASAPTVDLLLSAGALLIGKTNLDQFATGLVGVRSPYGICHSVFDPEFISGGSSAGSAVAVAAGLVSFAFGTDTAGSGRVPAAFNNIVGWKPTRGLVSARGVVPACRSLDCVSVFSQSCFDAHAVARVISRFDPEDPFARAAAPPPPAPPARFRFGVPSAETRKFFGDPDTPALFERAIEQLRELGGTEVEIDLRPFCDVAQLLYSGPWVAERLAAIRPFFRSHPQSLHPVTAQIIGAADHYTAVDAFEGIYRLEELRRITDSEWSKMDVMVLPTAGTTYRISDVLADPIELNSNLGYYTNFVNLLDLCGVAVPAGFDSRGLPFGISFLGRAFADNDVLALAGRFHRRAGGRTGATDVDIAELPEPEPTARSGRVDLAVLGAHLSGQPLNHQLTDRRATLVRTTRTAPRYRLYALSATTPAKPGLVRDPASGKGSIEVEVWSLDLAEFGSFVAAVPPPLAIGTLELEDGSLVKGFICEGFATKEAPEITAFGGWRRYLGSQSASLGASADALRGHSPPS